MVKSTQSDSAPITQLCYQSSTVFGVQITIQCYSNLLTTHSAANGTISKHLDSTTIILVYNRGRHPCLSPDPLQVSSLDHRLQSMPVAPARAPLQEHHSLEESSLVRSCFAHGATHVQNHVYPAANSPCQNHHSSSVGDAMVSLTLDPLRYRSHQSFVILRERIVFVTWRVLF